MTAPAAVAILDRRLEDGATVELHQRGEALDIVVDGRRVMRSDQRRAEKQLVELALAPLGQRDDITVVLAGLGMGFTLRALLDTPGVTRVDVVESSAAVIEWEKRHFAGLNGDALHDPRVHLHAMDLTAFLKSVRLPGADLPVGDGWLALILDMDEGPSQPVRAGNAAFYTDDGIDRLEAALRPGGVLALWSAAREADLLQRMHARLKNVAEIVVPVDLDDQSSLDYVYRGRRPPAAVEAKGPLN
ncbi:MAG: spermidine synthase [Myxococcales bacterium]|nr:spermidine synthase [Myxococcales bacterium]